jgi:hypothetical protein
MSDAMDRYGFYIHGGVGDASKGCIIMHLEVRKNIRMGDVIHVHP